MTTITDTNFTIIPRNTTTGRDFFMDMKLSATKYSDRWVITGREGRKMAYFKISADVEFVNNADVEFVNNADVEFVNNTEIIGSVYFSSGKVYLAVPILVKVHNDGHISLIAQVTP